MNLTGRDLKLVTLCDKHGNFMNVLLRVQNVIVRSRLCTICNCETSKRQGQIVTWLCGVKQSIFSLLRLHVFGI